MGVVSSSRIVRVYQLFKSPDRIISIFIIIIVMMPETTARTRTCVRIYARTQTK